MHLKILKLQWNAFTEAAPTIVVHTSRRIWTNSDFAWLNKTVDRWLAINALAGILAAHFAPAQESNFFLLKVIFSPYKLSPGPRGERIIYKHIFKTKVVSIKAGKLKSKTDGINIIKETTAFKIQGLPGKNSMERRWIHLLEVE